MGPCGHMNINNALWLSGITAQLEGLILTLARPERWNKHMPIHPMGSSGRTVGVCLYANMGTWAIKKRLNMCLTCLALEALLAATQARIPILMLCK